MKYLFAFCMAISSVFGAYAQSLPPYPAEAMPTAEERSKFFQDAKSARLVNGRTVNCCGEGDGVLVRMTGYNFETKVGTAIIVDTLKSYHGKVGDTVTVPQEVTTTNLGNPFQDAVAFIRADNSAICITGVTGG